MSSEWITASEAREMVCPGWKHNGGPTDIICHRAAAGIVRSKASLFKVTGGDATEQRDHHIPKTFWGGSTLQQHWASGDFSTWIHSQGREVHCEAYGVTFARADIAAMVPSMNRDGVSSLPAPPVNRSKGGRPAGADWEAIMIELARQLYVGELKPKRQSDIETAIADYLSGRNINLSESTIREHARPLWQAIDSEDGE